MAEGDRTEARREPETAARIVDATIRLAEEVGWGDVRLHEIADRLGLPLVEVSAHFQDLDAVADAWFARARDAALAVDGPELAARPAPDRLFLVMMRWFDAVGAHRGVARQILAEKLFYPSHPHHWVPMPFHLSRLMHWFLDAARIRGTGRMRQMEEIGLTAIFLATLAVWAGDDTPAQERTRRFLRTRLDRADRLMALVWGGGRASTASSNGADGATARRGGRHGSAR